MPEGTAPPSPALDATPDLRCHRHHRPHTAARLGKSAVPRLGGGSPQSPGCSSWRSAERPRRFRPGTRPLPKIGGLSPCAAIPERRAGRGGVPECHVRRLVQLQRRLLACGFSLRRLSSANVRMGNSGSHLLHITFPVLCKAAYPKLQFVTSLFRVSPHYYYNFFALQMQAWCACLVGPFSK